VVSKKKFVRDMMRMQDERRYDEKETEAKAMIEQPCGYYSEKTYSHGKKYTKQVYQC